MTKNDHKQDILPTIQPRGALPRLLSTHAGACVLLWLAGIYLRLTVLVAPPLSPLIGADLKLGQAALGALTTLPTLLLAAVAIPGAFIVGRMGARRTMIASLVILALGSGLRGAGGVFGLFAMTFVMGAGISVMQPALPALAHRWCPSRIGLATAIYTNGLLVGEILSAGLTLPVVLPLLDGSWRWSFAAWSAPALIVALCFKLRPPGGEDRIVKGEVWWPDWRRGDVWICGLLLGGTAIVYFGANAYLPGLLNDRGTPEYITPALISLNGAQMLSSGYLLMFSERHVARRAPLLITGFGAVAALAAAVMAQGAWTVAMAGLVGFFTSFSMILLMALPPVIGGRERTASLAAGMFTVGYACSFVVPLAGGMAWDYTGLAQMAFAPIGAFSFGAAMLAFRLPVRKTA